MLKSSKAREILAALSVWSIISGAEEAGGDAGQGGDGSGGTGESGSGKEGESKSGDGGSDDDKDDLDKLDEAKLRQKLRNLQEEQERHFRKRKEAEAEADELRKFKEEQERKGRTEIDNLKTDLQKALEASEAKDEVIRRLTVENAFSMQKDVQWHNPARALRLVDLSEVKIGKNGQVENPDALVKAVKELAASDPYLVVPKEESSSKEQPKKSGAGAGKKQDVDKTTADEELRKKYPALRR